MKVKQCDVLDLVATYGFGHILLDSQLSTILVQAAWFLRLIASLNSWKALSWWSCSATALTSLQWSPMPKKHISLQAKWLKIHTYQILCTSASYYIQNGHLVCHTGSRAHFFCAVSNTVHLGPTVLYPLSICPPYPFHEIEWMRSVAHRVMCRAMEFGNAILDINAWTQLQFFWSVLHMLVEIKLPLACNVISNHQPEKQYVYNGGQKYIVHVTISDPIISSCQ